MRFFDCHNDLLTEFKFFERELDILNRQNMKYILPIYSGKRNCDEILMIINRFLKAKNENMYLAFEDFSFSKPDNYEMFLNFSPKYVSLTHNKENQLASGCDFHGGLKEEGEILIRELNRRKIPLCLSHLNHKSFFEAIEKADNVLASHSNMNSFYFHNRNLYDEEIKLIIEKKGIIGLTFVDYFVSGKLVLARDIARLIFHFCERHGSSSLVIGTDFNGTKALPLNLTSYLELNNLKHELLKLGFGIKTIDEIFYSNLNRYINNF